MIASNESAKFGWYNALYTLANGEYLNIPEVLLRPIDESLMFLLVENARSYDEATTLKAINK